LQKAAISFIMSDCLLGTTQLLLDGSSWNLMFKYFSNIYQENSSSTKTGKE
jgi:hypothetical protein